MTRVLGWVEWVVIVVFEDGGIERCLPFKALHLTLLVHPLEDAMYAVAEPTPPT